jgi:hypothetical protein
MTVYNQVKTVEPYQRILGHENRTTTEIYLHSIDEIDRAALEYLGAQIEKKSHTDSHTEIDDCSYPLTR